MSAGWGSGSSRRWRELRERILKRDRGECQICYPGCKVKATHVDHIVPKSKGGSDRPSNLRAACAYCNQKRGDGTSATARRADPPPRDPEPRPLTNW